MQGSVVVGGVELVPDSLIGNMRLACHAIPALRRSRLARAWAGLVAPGGTPAPVVERLALACARAAQRPEFREFVARFGAQAVGSSPQDFARYLRNERSQLHALIIDNNIRAE